MYTLAMFMLGQGRTLESDWSSAVRLAIYMLYPLSRLPDAFFCTPSGTCFNAGDLRSDERGVHMHTAASHPR